MADMRKGPAGPFPVATGAAAYRASLEATRN